MPQFFNQNTGVDPLAALNKYTQMPMQDVGSFFNQGAPATPSMTIPTNNTPVGGGGMFDNFMSQDGQQGWGAPAMQGVGALANSWLGFQNLGVAKDQLSENKRQFQLNYDEQKANQDQYYADRGTARAAAFA